MTGAAPPTRSSVSPLARLLGLAARIGTQIFTRVRFEGSIDAIPSAGPVILAANHVSNVDGVLLGGWVIPRLSRQVQWLGKREMFEVPIMGRVVRDYGVHPVERSGADLEAFRIAEGILDGGGVLLLFPEGTRSRDGSLQKPRDGLAMLALRTGATIVPIGVSNTDKVWPRGQKMPRPQFKGHVTVRVGQPFRLADELPSELSRKEAKTQATELIMRRIAALLPARQRGPYA
jgi:1-acyl-sn-glycerol-3-phosphate acyltransferase